MFEDTFTHRIDDVEIISEHEGKKRLIGFGSFDLLIHYVKELGSDVWWEISDVMDETGVSFAGGKADPTGEMIICHLKRLTSSGREHDRIETEIGYRLPHEDANAEHRLMVRDVL